MNFSGSVRAAGELDAQSNPQASVGSAVGVNHVVKRVLG